MLARAFDANLQVVRFIHLCTKNVMKNGFILYSCTVIESSKLHTLKIVYAHEVQSTLSRKLAQGSELVKVKASVWPLCFLTWLANGSKKVVESLTATFSPVMGCHWNFSTRIFKHINFYLSFYLIFFLAFSISFISSGALITTTIPVYWSHYLFVWLTAAYFLLFAFFRIVVKKFGCNCCTTLLAALLFLAA